MTLYARTVGFRQSVLKNKFMSQELSIVEKINAEVSSQLANKETMNVLISNTFKKLNEVQVRSAIVEGMIRGFKFEDFLKKDVYALPYGSGYSLVTAIDYNRKIGQKSGIVGTLPPVYKEVVNQDGTTKIISCSVTVKKQFENGHIGDFTAEVYFDEYYKKGSTYNNVYQPSMWDSKPRTMIAKVAEMHALRKACPEELGNSYVEEEMQKPIQAVAEVVIDTDSVKKKIEATLTIDELKAVWVTLSPQERNSEAVKQLYLDHKNLINSENKQG